MRASGKGELPRHAREVLDKIPFSMVAFECGVRVPLASFVRRVLNGFPLPFALSLATLIGELPNLVHNVVEVLRLELNLSRFKRLLWVEAAIR